MWRTNWQTDGIGTCISAPGVHLWLPCLSSNVGIAGGLGDSPPPSSCLKTLILDWESVLNFNPCTKYQTFRHLTPNSIRLIANMLSSRSSALPSLATIAAHTRDFSCGHSLPCYVRLFVFQFSKLVDGPLLPLWSSASSDATTGTAGP